MGRVAILLVIVVALALVAGCLFLAYGSFPAPVSEVQKVVPDARFPK